MIPVAEAQPTLTVIEGGRAKQHREEAGIEYRVLLDEVERLATSIQTHVAAMHVPSMGAMQDAGRIGLLVTRARAELDDLTRPDDAA